MRSQGPLSTERTAAWCGQRFNMGCLEESSWPEKSEGRRRKNKKRLLWVRWGRLQNLKRSQKSLSSWDSMLWGLGSHGRFSGREMVTGP